MEVSQNNVGQSLKVISDMAKEKGYFPLCYTGNLFLVREEYTGIFKDDIKDLESMYIDFLTHLDDNGVKHLFETFILRNRFNGHTFHNDVLKRFCSDKG